jgi:sigma-B regulation protein RsbU (phosphoserine phosphatase)
MEHTMQRTMFITMVYAVIDLETEQLTLARAGHELPIFYDQHTKGGLDVEPIQSPGMAVGMVPPAIFDSIIKDTSIHFGSNDVLLLYTDGVTESANARGDEYGSERLIELLRNHGDKDAQEIIEQTLDSVKRFSQSTGQHDDLTLIAVKHA